MTDDLPTRLRRWADAMDRVTYIEAAQAFRTVADRIDELEAALREDRPPRSGLHTGLLLKASDRIEELAAENERLREVLRRIVASGAYPEAAMAQEALERSNDD